MPIIGADMLTQTAKIIEERQSQYGPPEKNFKVIAARWNAHLEGRGYRLTDASGMPVMLDMSDVAHMSADIKMARLSENMAHEDSWKDLAGYAACGRQVTAKADRSPPSWFNNDYDRRIADDFAKAVNRVPLWVDTSLSPSEVPDDLKAGDRIKVMHGSGDKVVTVGAKCAVPSCQGRSYIGTDGIHWDSTEIIAYRRT